MTTTELLNRMWRVIEAAAPDDPFIADPFPASGGPRCIGCGIAPHQDHESDCWWVEARAVLAERS